MLHTKYQDSRPYGFRQEDFSCFHYVSRCKAYDPRAEPMLAQGAQIEPLGRSILDDAS